MIALITAALHGLAAIREFVELFRGLNLKERLDRIEERQSKMNSAFSALAASETSEEKKNALRDIADSWNS